MKLLRLFLLLPLMLPLVLIAQVSFEAVTDAGQVVPGSYFEVSFILKNAQGSEFKAPDFGKLRVAAGPSRSVSTTSINGQVSTEMSLSYTLVADQPGNYIIGPAVIKAGNRELRSKPFAVTVVQENEKSNKAVEEPVVLRAEINTRTAWVGEPVIVDYKLYTMVDIDSYNVLQESDYQGFYAEDLRRYEGRVQREVIQGQPYTTKVLKRVVLYPQQAGSLEVGSMLMQISIPVNSGEGRGFFLFPEVQRREIRSDTAVIRVKSLPAGAPDAFTGAVGRFSLSAAISRNKVTTDDAISLTLTLEGNGDIKRVQAPALNLPPDFEVYDPKVLEATTSENGNQLSSRKVIEYLLLPKQPGTYTITPAFSFFDPDSSKYATVKAQTFTIAVRQGSGAGNSSKAGATAPSEESQDIRFIHTDTSLKASGRSFWGTPVFWLLLLTPVLLMAFSFGRRYELTHRAPVDQAALRKSKALEAARLRMQAAEKVMGQKGFFHEIVKALQTYVEDKLGMSTAELSKPVLHEKLTRMQVSGEAVSALLQCWQTCEIAVFADQYHLHAPKEILETAVSAIARIEEELNKG